MANTGSQILCKPLNKLKLSYYQITMSKTKAIFAMYKLAAIVDRI